MLLAFNRTSLESKPDIPTQEEIDKGLLIEPVWNRNMGTLSKKRCFRIPFNRTSLESKPLCLTIFKEKLSTFNRTSLESKHVCEREAGLHHAAFNRTSLESKHNRVDLPDGRKLALLIEPVWNRNVQVRCQTAAAVHTLLIEPVWNRNFDETEEYPYTVRYF